MNILARRVLTVLLGIGLVIPALGVQSPAVVAATPAAIQGAKIQSSEMQNSGVQIADTAHGVSFAWTRTTQNLEQTAAEQATTDWQAEFASQLAGEHLLPIYSFSVWPRMNDIPAQELINIQILEQVTRPFSGALPPAPSLTPNALDYTRPDYVEPFAAPPLPTSPLTILRESRTRGQAEIIIAFNPIYQDVTSGQLVQVDQIRAEIGNVIRPGAGDAQAAATVGVAGAYALEAVPPTNPLANQAAWKITVATGGIQELKAADLGAAGLSNPATNTLALYHNGEEVALHIIDANDNGRIDGANDALRFYAPPPGDLWNLTATYWLAQGNTDRARMSVAPAAAAAAPIRTTAYAQGVWRQPKLYNSNIPGTHGDYWFHLDALARADVPIADRRFAADIAPTLPLAQDTDLDATIQLQSTLYRLEGSNFTNTPHLLRFSAQDGAQQEVPYSFAQGGSMQNVTFDHTLAAPTPSLTVSFLVGERPLGILFDSVHWQQPVNLNFRVDGENRGADFFGIAGSWRYRLRNLPAGAHLYDVSDPVAPRRVALSNAGDDKLFGATQPACDDCTGGVGHYIIAGPGTVHAPDIAAHTPINLRAGGADALYIAPAEFHNTLEPLLQLRRDQGYSVAVVTPQHIYDSWSFGQVAPNAIRNFLRHSVATWRPAPISVVFVGDGPHDPHSILTYGNPNFIPPYLAHVDPHNGQTACESCYGQLDGADPLNESAFAMDIWVGRLPVINSTELRSVVNKIVRYEQASDVNAPWRRTSLQIADDYFRPDGTLDDAGDFVASAESINALKPGGIRVKRHYFNVALTPAQLAGLDSEYRALYESYAAWFTNDPDAAQQKSIQLMNEGAGLVTYTGHANHWKWAGTTPDSENNQLFGLVDVNNLHNLDELFIGLSMTCYTSLFSEPAPAHFTLDERLVLRPSGGAVATWGPSGLSIVYAHDMLQKGFHEALWEADPMTARMGELIEAGYAEVRRQSCCQDVLKTFLLLGDPLMPARLNSQNNQYLPTLQSAD
ncbi:MAG: C25 family cysteine peptidase [Litorilinea sp.]